MKSVLVGFAMTLIFVLTTSQVNAPKAPVNNQLTVSLPLDDWNTLIFIVNNRNVKSVSMNIDPAIIDTVVAQLQKQIQAINVKQNPKK